MRQIKVRITETIEYEKTYSVEELAKFVDPAYDDPELLHTQSATAIAEVIRGNEEIEAELNDHGEVINMAWAVVIDGDEGCTAQYPADGHVHCELKFGHNGIHYAKGVLPWA